MGKVLIILLAIAVALWALGVDVASVKQAMNGTASEGSRTLTGQSDDWG